MMKFKSIGLIRTEYIEKAPRQAINSAVGHYLEIKNEYTPALYRLEEFKYINVLYYLDRSKFNIDIDLVIKEEDKSIGTFATRSSIRPNPIALSTVELIRIKENKIFISGIDALDKSPIIDIKPYIKELDIKSDANSGWMREDNMLDNKIYLYTDGACSGNPGPGGYAALIVKDNQEFVVAGYEKMTTNNRMEMMAVIEGLKEIKAGSEVKLVSDSNYVLNGLKDWVSNWKKRGWKTASNKAVKNKELWVELDNLSKDYKLEYIKVKGHSGHKYNERVDLLAKEQIQENN